MTLFSAPNYCGEFDNAGSMMSVDETLMCSFQVIPVNMYLITFIIAQIIKPKFSTLNSYFSSDTPQRMVTPDGARLVLSRRI